jgi:hypothetical protein
MQLLYDAATITITYDPAQECLLVTWQGTHPGWSALPYCEEILAHVRATGCSRILNDGSQDEDEWGELVGWLTADFFPRLAANGVQAVAWVKPARLAAHATVNRVVQAVSYLSIVLFEDVEAAYVWLCQAKKGGK